MNKRITLAALAGLSTLVAILIIPGFFGTNMERPPLTSTLPQPPISDAQEVIENRVAKLPLGEVYHNVPDQMQSGVQEIIEAGITPKITKQIREKIRGKGKVITQSGIRFDPSGVDMKLVADSEEFKVSPIKGGKQFVTPKLPGKWIWEVKPLKSGEHYLALMATVEVKVPELNVTHPVEVEVFRDVRNIKVNWSYSIQEFVKNNWKESIVVVFGSSSVAGFVSWWFGDRKKEKA